MTKVLITGSNSFIGRNFIRYSHYKDVTEISLLEIEPEDIDFRNFDVVLHLAAIVHESKKILREEYFRVNCDLPLNVAKFAKKSGIKQFIFMSTLKVYGGSTNSINIRNELSICEPCDPYGQSKFKAEIGLKKLEDSKFVVTIIRPSLVYGEGVKANMQSLIKLVDLCPVLPFGKLTNMRNYLYVENLVGYIDKVIEKRSSGVYIAIDAKPVSTTELVSYISKYLCKKTILIALPRIILRSISFLFPGVSEKLFGSFEFENSQTLEELNFTVPDSTEEGIRKTILSYKG